MQKQTAGQVTDWKGHIRQWWYLLYGNIFPGQYFLFLFLDLRHDESLCVQECGLFHNKGKTSVTVHTADSDNCQLENTVLKEHLPLYPVKQEKEEVILKQLLQ